MVKAKDFLHYLCEKQNYRSFVGVPCKEMQGFYSHMNSDIMHYVPAINTDIAIGIAAGNLLNDFKSVVITTPNNFALSRKDFIVNLPVLFIVSDDVDTDEFLTTKLTTKKSLDQFFKDPLVSKHPSIISLGGKSI